MGWLFLVQINDLREFDVERAMGIENLKLKIKASRKSIPSPALLRLYNFVQLLSSEALSPDPDVVAWSLTPL